MTRTTEALTILSGLSGDWQGHFAGAGNTSIDVFPTSRTSNDRSVSDTVGLMARHAVKASSDSKVIQACKSAGVQEGRPAKDNLNSIFRWVKSNVRFTEDETQLAKIFQQPNDKELLITPPVLLSMNTPMGDCDDFSMLCCSMCLASGIPCNFVTIGADTDNPNTFTHVYCQSNIDGEQIPVDCSHGEYLGWESPVITKKMVWPVIAGGKGLGMILKSNALKQGVVRGGFSGMGDIDWGSIIGGAFTTAEKIGVQLTQPVGYQVTNPNGSTVSYVTGAANTASPVPLPNLNFGGTSISGTTMLLIGGALVLVLAMGRK